MSAYDPDASFGGDARVPSLEPYGLARVPGHDDGNPAWRDEWFAWRDAVGELRGRLQVAGASSPAFRAEELRICADDPAYFATAYPWIHEPRARRGEEVYKPFVPFAFQVKLVQHMADLAAMPEPADLFVSKARGLGASWTACLFGVWHWLFRLGDGFMVSRKEELVDKPQSMKSLFGKIDFILRFLPPWMLPAGFKPKEHRLKMLLKNPATGATIGGESTTSKTGRGDRATYAVVDEAAFIEHFDDVFGTIAGTTDHRFAVSSESFEEGDAWWKAWGGSGEGGAKQLTPHLVYELNWGENPYFTQEWFAAERARWHHDPEGFAREVERDPYKGFGSFVYPTARSLPLLDIGYVPTEMLLVGIDPGHADDTAIVWGQPRWTGGNRGIHWLDSYERNLTPVEWYAHLLTGVEPAPGDECWGMPVTDRDRAVMAFFASLPWGGDRVRYYMDPAGAARHSGISFYDLFVKKTMDLRTRAAAGVRRPHPIAPLYKALRHAGNLHDDRRNATRAGMAFSSYEDNQGGKRTKACHVAYSFTKMTGKATSEPKPVHDTHSHIVTATEFVYFYLTLGLAEPPRRVAPASDRHAYRMVA
ncbi:MAG: hypothetical protein M3Q74_04200 [Pseudomonadota bacterium]|nr:hypothetical protein [Pseudomonadota bacterium]